MLAGMIPAPARETLRVRAFALLKIPLLAFTGPVVEDPSEDHVVIRVPLTWRTKNHLGGMYFGALLIGAELASGLPAIAIIPRYRPRRVDLVFRRVSAEFLKRAEGDVLFTCTEAHVVRELIERSIASGAREEGPVRVTATVPSRTGEEPVARFELVVSIKAR
jgi:acyl-coenzyme A thioesterase PaaI-like protein